MRNSAAVVLCLLIVNASVLGQEPTPKQTLAGWFASRPVIVVEEPIRVDGKTGLRVQAIDPKSENASSQPVRQASCSESGCCASNSNGCTTCCGSGCGGLHWTRECFPHNACPDDYCPSPFPRQCWPPYPSFYRCVPAGDCAGCRDRSTDDLTWWFIPKPRALREAIGWQP